MTDQLRQAAQQALEALESGLAFDTHSDVLQNLRTALEQQAEPVFENLDYVAVVYSPINAMLKSPLPIGTHLYKYPPQRPWVGLTDEEIYRTTVLLGFNPEWKTDIGMAHAVVRNLETKLKERNT